QWVRVRRTVQEHCEPSLIRLLFSGTLNQRVEGSGPSTPTTIKSGGQRVERFPFGLRSAASPWTFVPGLPLQPQHAAATGSSCHVPTRAVQQDSHKVSS